MFLRQLDVADEHLYYSQCREIAGKWDKNITSMAISGSGNGLNESQLEGKIDKEEAVNFCQ